jgi:hypothetical protein
MSTVTVKPKHGGPDRPLTIYGGFVESGCVRVYMGDVSSCLDRTDFLAAVASELNVAVIDRAEFPEARTLGDEIRAGGFAVPAADPPEKVRRYALAHLAMAEHLAANPGVDEGQVRAIADLIDDAYPGLGEFADLALPALLARRLVKAGVRVVTS